ncbi:hypothetical protein ACFY0P_33595 [Streptomyces sp. NPDC001714]|uniref:hypothetical protein n=1 Tax=Streptomyces sp. NPDC001714 TaxID=3364603 RepID=UPI00367DBF0D
METATDDDLRVFCRQIRERSREHQEAMPVAAERGWVSMEIGILRQELDSIVRVIYLLKQPSALRADLVASSISGNRWRIPTDKGKMKAVTDRDMVELAQSMNGWTRNVYEFGCRFIHLSSAHDYLARDPFLALPIEEREIIAKYINHYHGHPGGSVSASSSFNDIVAYAPSILKKISSNLESELATLEGDRCT